MSLWWRFAPVPPRPSRNQVFVEERKATRAGLGKHHPLQTVEIGKQQGTRSIQRRTKAGKRIRARSFDRIRMPSDSCASQVRT